MFQRTKGRVALAAIMAAAVAVSVAACSSPSGGSASSDKKGTVGIVEWDTATPVDNSFYLGAKAALQKDVYQIVSQDPKADSAQANSICQQFVTRQVQDIVIITHPLSSMTQCMSAAAAAKIPVFYIGSPLQTGMAGAIDVSSPKATNDVFLKYVKDNKTNSILTLDYSPGTPCLLRAQYRDKILKGLDIQETSHQLQIPGQVVDAQNTTAAWLNGHPEGAGKYAIWACFTDPASGAAAAVQQAGRKDIQIFTWDFNKEIQQLIDQGYVYATFSLQGKVVGSQVVGLIDKYNSTGKPQSAASKGTILTKENVDQFVKDNPSVLDQ